MVGISKLPGILRQAGMAREAQYLLNCIGYWRRGESTRQALLVAYENVRKAYLLKTGKVLVSSPGTTFGYLQ